MIDLDDLLMQIEEEINGGKKTLLGGGTIVNGDRVLAIVESIRENLPDAVKEAKYILNNSEKRRIDDLNRGQNILMVAQQRATELLSEHTISETAEIRAKELIQQAKEFQERLISDTRHNLYDLIHNTEKRIEDILHEISALKEDV